ncbi:IS66 family transposase [Nannocystis pusilla]|uniref:IS66 family transposase n=1 Tax=Nannocystis pusilla TaxID=889268 RepID=UPI003BF311F3
MTEVELVRHELESRMREHADTIDKLTAERERYKTLYLELLERCKLLEKGIVVGKKAERFTAGDDPQLALQILEMMLAGRDVVVEEVEEEIELDDAEDEDVDHSEVDRPAPARRRSRGRRPLPENLPRVEIEVLPPEVVHEGLDAFARIGQVVSEVVERRPASLVVARIVRPKFVRKGEAPGTVEDQALEAPAVQIAERLELPIERGLAGPGLLADTIVHRWQDHLPANRLEALYARDGLQLARSTICGWHEQLADLVEPLVEAMFADAFTQPYLCTDATGVLVQAKEQCQRAHFWVLVAPERHVLFRFSPAHDSEAVDRLLKGYTGYLVADAHAVYDHLYATGDVFEVGCWAHCRRYFFKCLGSEPELARHALSLIKTLFKIERALATAPRKKRESARQAKSKPLVDAFFLWCDQQAAIALDGTPLARALGYARNQRIALQRFLGDGRLPLENNISERNLRREVIGRKNWLFLGSEEGARANTLFVSLLASCQLHRIEPWAYLRDLLCLLPSWPRRRVLELAPAFWQETLKQEDAQQRLAANVFRGVSLGKHASEV